MNRHFGMKSPVGNDGGTTITDRASRVGETRDSEIQDLLIPSEDIREFAAWGFAFLCVVSILVALLLLCLIPFGSLFGAG